LPLRTKTRKVGEKSDPQLLYHCGFTMLMRHRNSNIRPNPIPSIEEILSNCRMRSVPTNARINVMVESWSLSTRTKSSTMPTVNLDGIVGEDELSCQSTYEDGMKEIQPHYEGLFGNEKLIQDGQLLRIYTKLLKALNEIRLQIALNDQPVMKFNGKSFNTYIAQLKAKEFVTDVDDIEFEDWCVTNTHAYFWYCADVSKSPLLKTAIENVLKKSPNADLSGSLFDEIHDVREHQFVGFVSSDTTKSKVLNSFHLHSFVTFYTEMQKKTIITCVLTTRHHIHSNMQDQLMQLVQLIQYAKIESLSMSLSNKVMNVSITPNDRQACKSLGFDTSSFNEDDDCFSFDINIPIPMVQYHDSYTWGKYCQRFMELDFYGEGQVKNNLHGSFCSSVINFLQPDIAGTPTYSMNPNILGQL
jgi:hypothetical protein